MLNKMPTWDEEDCSYLLRHMELTTFTNVVTALRAQGILSKSKSAFLESARRIFFIGDEVFKAEIRRVANDENLIRIAAVLNPNYDSYADWGLLGAEFEEENDVPQPRMFDSKNSQSVASALLSIADAHNGRVEEDRNSNPIYSTGEDGCIPKSLDEVFNGSTDVVKKVNDALTKARKNNKEKYDKLFVREKTVEPEDSDEETPETVAVVPADSTVSTELLTNHNIPPVVNPNLPKPVATPVEKLVTPMDKMKTPTAKQRAQAEKSPRIPSEKTRASAEKSRERARASTEKMRATLDNSEISVGKTNPLINITYEKSRPTMEKNKVSAERPKGMGEKFKPSTHEPVRSAVDEEVLKLLKQATAESERAEMKAGQSAKQIGSGGPASQKSMEVKKPTADHKMSLAEMNVQKELMKRAGEVENIIAKKAAAAAVTYKPPLVSKASSFVSVPLTRNLAGTSAGEMRIERNIEPSALRKELEKANDYIRPLGGLDVRRQLEAKTLEARAHEAKSLESRTREELRALEAQHQGVRALEAKSDEMKALEAKALESRVFDMHSFEAKTLKTFVLEAKALEASIHSKKTLEDKAMESRMQAANVGKTKPLVADPSRRLALGHPPSSRLDSVNDVEDGNSLTATDIIDRIHSRRRPKPTELADKIQLPPTQSRAPPRPVSGFLPVSPRVPNLTITSSSASPVLPKRPRLSSGSDGTSSPSYPKEYPVMRAPVTAASAKQKHVPGILQHDGQRKPRTVSQSSSCTYLGPARSSNSPVRPQVRPVGVAPSISISALNPSMSPQDTGSHHGHGHDYGVPNSARSYYRPLAMGQHTGETYYKSSPPGRQRVPTSTSLSFNQNTNLFPVGQVMFRRDGTSTIGAEVTSSQIGRRMGGVGNNVTTASMERMRERIEQPRYEHSTVPSTSPLHLHSSHAHDISNARQQIQLASSRQSHVAIPSVSVEASRPGVSVQTNAEAVHASKDKKSDPINTKFSR